MDRRLFWLAIGAFATSTVAFAFAGLLPLIAESAGISIPQAGHLISSFSLAYAICTPILSTITGTADRKRVLAGALLMFMTGNVLAAASSSFATLLMAQILMGMAAGLFASTAQATAVAISGFEHRARAVAAVVGGTTFAVALGAPLGTLIGTLAGWRATFLFIALLALICVAAIGWKLPRGIPGVRLPLVDRLLVVTRPGVLPSLAVTVLYITGGFMVISYLAPIATIAAGLPKSAVPGMLLAFGVGAVAGNYASGRLADRLGATRVVVMALVSSAILCAVFTLVLTTLPAAIAGPLIMALMVPWGFIGWTFPPAQAARIVGLAPDVSTLTLSLNASAMYFGIAFGSLAGGIVLRHLPPADLGMMAAPFPIAALVIIALGLRSARPAAPQNA